MSPLSQSTFCSWGVDMSWFCSVCEKSFSRKEVWKGTWCLNTALLVSPHFKQFQQCFHRNVSGFASSILLPPWLPEWPGPEKRHGFDLYYRKLQRQFTFPGRESFGVIHNGILRMQNASGHATHWIRQGNSRLWSRIPIFMWTNGIWSCLMIRWLTQVKTSELWPSLLVVLIIAI